MSKLLAFTFTVFFLLSCAPQYRINRQSSVFSSINELGSTKNDFISKYGSPINKDLKENENKVIERLYYVEIIDAIIVTTSFTFLNDTLIEQSNHNMDFNSKRIQDLQGQVKRNRLKMIRIED